MDGPNALGLNERLLELLSDAGLDRTEAARASYLLIVYVIGSMALEVADADHTGPLSPEADRIAARDRALSATSSDQFPHSSAATSTMAGYISTDRYPWGLRRVLDGITARMTVAPASPSGGGRPVGSPATTWPVADS